MGRVKKPVVPKAPEVLAATAADVSAKKSRASKSGIRGETIVAAFHAAARAHGIAALVHVPTPTRRVKTKHGWSMIFTARSVVDSLGYMLDGTARVVAEEIKTCTSKPALYLREVEDHQRAFLDAVDEAGGVAILTVVHGPEHAVATFSWSDVRALVKVDAAALAANTVTPSEYLNSARRFGALREVA